MSDTCGDNRFELIEKYKQKLIESTNIESSEEEMAVIDHILFRFWQMGWLDKLEMMLKIQEKDTPKAPKKSDIPRYGMGYEYYDWYCPTCNKFLAYEGDPERKRIHHCKCGQRLDWSD